MIYTFPAFILFPTYPLMAVAGNVIQCKRGFWAQYGCFYVLNCFSGLPEFEELCTLWVSKKKYRSDSESEV